MLTRRELKLRSLPLAADARLSRTDYTDDQTWDFLPGEGESPALAFQTRYGGRVGLASIVPMWSVSSVNAGNLAGSRMIYQAQTYSRPPITTGFAPGFVRAEGELIPSLAITAEYWVMESHAAGARYTLHNTGTQEISLHLDMFGHVVMQGEEQKLAIVTLADGLNALSFGNIFHIAPVVLLENGRAVLTPGRKASSKVGVDVTVAAGGQAIIRWVHAGTDDLRNSLALAQSWLSENWDEHFAQIAQAAQAIPVIDTGQPDIDAAIAVSYHHLVQSFLKPTGSLPYASYVASRHSAHGFSPAGDGSDHDRGWSGQTPQLSYLVAPAVSTIDPALAHGILLNYLAVQGADGAIDMKPGFAGQRAGMMATPLLARLAWAIFQYTGSDDFLRESLPKLFKFYTRWFAHDKDKDGFPEWENERQIGYIYFPTFAQGQNWAQNGDISYIEGPGMGSYLLSEGISLREMARHLKSTGMEQDVYQYESAVRTRLDDLWHNGRYVYRDWATHATSAGSTLIEDGRADEEQFPAAVLNPPARLIIRVTGGTTRAPRFTLTIEGVGMDDQPVTETVTEFAWYRGYGAYTTLNVYKEVKRIYTTGLSRVYKMDVHTFDTSRMDIHMLLPLWSMGITTPRSEELLALLTDTAQFWRPNGVSMVPATDENFDPSNQKGAGGVWPFWFTLIGEGLWDYGHIQPAYEMLMRLLRAQAEVLRESGHFYEFYHSEEAKGLGDSANIGGIVPLHLLNRVMGIRICSSSKVWTGGSFVWQAPITVRQHGVTVTRSTSGTRVEFPSGYVKELTPEDGWQVIIDPQAVATQVAPTVKVPEYPGVEQPNTGKVIIQVQADVPKPKPEANQPTE